jgi:hypothetical protein
VERLVSIFLSVCLAAGAVYGWLVTGRALATVVAAVVCGLAGLVLTGVVSVAGELFGRLRRAHRGEP